jgi:CysZ protein
MPNSLTSLVQSFQLLWSRKTRWPLVLGPIVLGIILYSTFFLLAYDFIGQKLQPWLVQAFNIDQMGFLVRWALMALITVIGFFLMNWTFVLVVSLFAAPFNDFLSESISDELEGKPFKRDRGFWSEILPFVWNETKKISVIIFFSFIAFAISFIPLLIPISLWISCMLIASQFVDYSWSRDKLTAKECMNDMRKNIFPYSISGALFFLLISVPIVNLFVPAWATSHFTLLFARKKKLQ